MQGPYPLMSMFIETTVETNCITTAKQAKNPAKAAERSVHILVWSDDRNTVCTALLSGRSRNITHRLVVRYFCVRFISFRDAPSSLVLPFASWSKQ